MRNANAFEVVRSMPKARCFGLGELRFAQFACPPQERAITLWAHTDHLIHVLTATSNWQTGVGTTWSASAGQTLFFKKGAYSAPPHVEPDLCLLVFFIPDAFVRETVRELASLLAPMPEPIESGAPAIRVHNDVMLSTFIHAMTEYFSANEEPPEPLLRLKLKELVTSILVGQHNRALAAYFRSVAACEAPAIAPIMEANFCHNLPLDAFARMCHRSLSSFKRDFRKHYGITPGRWLLERRLDCSANLLRTTPLSVTEIMMECGFEDPAHFSRAFKARHGRSPRGYRSFHLSDRMRPLAEYPASTAGS
jgi:AraC-like DNA-binding protein